MATAADSLAQNLSFANFSKATELKKRLWFTVGALTGANGQALDYDLIRIVQADAPFLVDSVMGALAEAGVSVRALYHPVVDCDARRLSVIILVIDGVPQERRVPVTRRGVLRRDAFRCAYCGRRASWRVSAAMASPLRRTRWR